jgi:hypothetical protein
VEGSGLDVTIPQFARRTRDNHEKPARILGLQADIGTQDSRILNRSTGRYFRSCYCQVKITADQKYLSETE